MKSTPPIRRATLAALISSSMLFAASPAGAADIAISNPSFETPSAGDGWYSGPALPSAAEFVWKNNLGEYGLTGKSGASHYTAAADGDQAVHLGQGAFISQTLGPTAPDTIYTLSFSILQSKFIPVADAAVKAEIFDGDHLLAARIFTVPAATDVWEAVTLVGKPVLTPAGELTIKFTGITAGAHGVGLWIDKIALTTEAVPAGTSLVNPSFEAPVVEESWWRENIPDSFGWENNLKEYALAGKDGASHYSAAADGFQALHLGRRTFISQKAGPTLPDTTYKLNFSLLQSKFMPSPGASLEAEIYDGENLLATEIFQVPDAMDVWQTFSLTADSPHTPSGELTIKFTGKTGGGSQKMGPWIDNISLTTTPAAAAVGTGNTGAENPPITVASYYFGNYHPNDPRNEKMKGKGWSEWELVKAAKPRFPGHQQPKIPLWGYTDESDPKVMEQKIAAAADHGIDAFIFDWYYYNDGPFLDRPIDEGFLKAKNNDRIKFAFMWANHDWLELHPYKKGTPRKLVFPGKVTPENFEKICDHLIKDYFSHPSYWKIDGKPYFSFYDLTKLLDNFGSVEATRAALDKFREKVKAAGFPGLHLNAVAWGQPVLPSEKVPVDSAKLVRDLGFDSVTSYVWIHHALLPAQQTDYNVVRDAYFKYWDKADKMFGVPYFPNVTMGWDPSPRCDQSDKFDASGYPFTNTIANNTPERFRAALEMTKKRLLANPNGPRILNINCWNEWTEGSYLEPDTKNGLKYLEAVQTVFPPQTKP
ncbi:MAG: DUF642 domain-containing protein [Verrucomicrobiaceae bacterium]|nr:MAG: DUF642 domain-containing protein [Verrucomicrobiaceae bacterium]